MRSEKRAWWLWPPIALIAYALSDSYLGSVRSPLLITDELRNGEETLVLHPLGWFYLPVIAVSGAAEKAFR